ncbi:MAG: helix-turn-helix transcriptional regulator [Planctomycetes bacterium]|jgi:AraC-like DNA-binding protein|nr:helix-turn-helix transcriptional regulator [Planctomycetota bacterium]
MSQIASARPLGAEAFEGFKPLSRALNQGVNRILDATRITPISARRWICAAHWLQLPRKLEDSMWYWIESGKGACWIGNPQNLLQFDQGCVIMLPSGVENSVWPADGEELKLVTVHFLANAYGALDVPRLLGLEGVHRETADHTFGRNFMTMAREFALRPPGWFSACTAAIVEVLLCIIRNLGSDMSWRTAADLRLLTRLEPVLDLVEKRLHDPLLSVTELAEAAFVSEVYLRRMFASAGLASPVEYVRSRRVEQASLLLRTSQLPIKEIASRCGFAQTGYFHRVFRQTTGQTPAACRRRTTEPMP